MGVGMRYRLVILAVVGVLLSVGSGACTGGEESTQGQGGGTQTPPSPQPPPIDVCPNVVNETVSQMLDCDSDGSLNTQDPSPYGGTAPASPGPGNGTTGCVYDPGDLDGDGLRTCDYVFDENNKDSDSDGLPDTRDPYPHTDDWDNDGLRDGDDPDISVDQDRLEEERLEERRLEEEFERDRQEQQRREEEWQEREREEEDGL